MTVRPRHWTRAILGDLATKLVDGSHNPPRAAADGHPMLSARNVANGRINWDDYRLIADADFKREDERTRVSPGDVLLTIVGSIGRTTVVPEDAPTFTLQRSVAVLSLPGLDPKFVSYQFEAPEFQRQLANEARGTAQKGVYLKSLGAAAIDVAPSEEQARIVDAVESFLSRLDVAVLSLGRAQAKLKAYRASVLKAAVEGRLVPTEAELARAEKRDYEPADVLLKRIVVERRRRWEEAELAQLKVAQKVPNDGRWKAKYREPAIPDLSRVPELAEGWCWTSASALYWDAGYGTSQKCSSDKIGPPVLRIPNVVAGRVSLRDLKFALDEKNLPPDGEVARGDFLFIRTNGSPALIGRGALVNDDYLEAHYFASYLIRLRLVRLEDSADWFAFMWHGPPIRAQILNVAASSAGQHNVSLTAASEFAVPVPPAAEQRRILAEVARLLSVCERLELDIAATAHRCARLRQAILKQAFAGNLTDQDPNDEPAEKLLERIRSERAAAPMKESRGRKTGIAS